MRCMDTFEYLSMGDAARLLGVTKARISQLAASGTLVCDIVGGRKMVEYNSAVAYQKVRKRGRRPAADVGRKFTLMSADYEVARVSFDPMREFPFEIAEVLDAQRMPFGTCSSSSPTVNKRELNVWWGHRSVPDVRPGLVSRYRELGIASGIEVPVQCLGLSLSDCYWLRPAECDGLEWRNLNYFENDFERSAPEERSGWLEGIGLKNPDNTSEGELPKSWMIRNGIRVLAKGCGMDDQRPFRRRLQRLCIVACFPRGSLFLTRLSACSMAPCACARILLTAARNMFRLFTLRTPLAASEEARRTTGTAAFLASMEQTRLP